MLKAKELIRTNVMLDKEILDTIDEFAKTMAEDRSTVIRQLIKKAISEERIEIAIKKFRTGVPFRKAAEIANLDYWDFQAELDKREVPVSSSLSLARARIKTQAKGEAKELGGKH
jgi:predicted HTH domain antitoxin